MKRKFKKSEFVESLRELYNTEFPNPDRIGCPDQERLRNFAWRKDLEHLQDVAFHLIQCSPCSQQEEVYLEEYRSHVRRKNIKTAWQIGAVVTALLALAAPWAWHDLKPSRRAENAGASQPTSGKGANRPEGSQEAHLRFHDPSLSQNPGPAGRDDDTLELGRGQLMVSIELPPDTTMEPFEVKISSPEDKPLILERGQVVRDENGKIQLRVPMNTTQLPAGQYLLGLRQGKLEWVTLPLWIK